MNMKRMRGRNHRPNGGGGGGGGGFRNQQNGIPLNRNHVFDSSGPEMRVRGTAQQLYDKYTQMARDAASSGDRVLGESYYQHAEHYFRIISAINQAQGIPNPPQNGQAQGNEGEGEVRVEQPRQEYRPENRGENRDNRPERYENRDNRQDNRQENRGENRGENRQENRGENRQENRGENRGDNQNRNRYEQRPRPEFQQRDRDNRGDRPFRQQTPIAESPIDISSALEAELAATIAEPAGYGEQPMIAQIAQPAITPPKTMPPASLQQELPIAQTSPAAPEPRAIPISAAAPPDEDSAPAKPRTRGRPRAVKVEAKAEE